MIKIKPKFKKNFDLHNGIKLIKNEHNDVFFAINYNGFQLYKADNDRGWKLIYYNEEMWLPQESRHWLLSEHRHCFNDHERGNLVFLLQSLDSSWAQRIIALDYSGAVILDIPCPDCEWLERFPCGDFLIYHITWRGKSQSML